MHGFTARVFSQQSENLVFAGSASVLQINLKPHLCRSRIRLCRPTSFNILALADLLSATYIRLLRRPAACRHSPSVGFTFDPTLVCCHRALAALLSSTYNLQPSFILQQTSSLSAACAATFSLDPPALSAFISLEPCIHLIHWQACVFVAGSYFCWPSSAGSHLRASQHSSPSSALTSIPHSILPPVRPLFFTSPLSAPAHPHFFIALHNYALSFHTCALTHPRVNYTTTMSSTTEERLGIGGKD